MSIFDKSLKDYLSAKFLGLSFATVLIPMIVMGILLVMGGSEIIDILTQGAQNDDFSFVDGENHPFLVTILKLTFVKWILVTLFYSLGTIFAVLLSLLIAMMVLGFLTPIVVSTLHKKYYSHIGELKPMNSIKVYKAMAMTILKFLVLLIVLIPFMWIPLVINIPFFYLFYKLMVVDVASNMMDENRLKVAEKRWFSKLFFLSLIFFVLSLIPIIGIFLQLFFAIYFAHFFFQNELLANNG